MQHTQRLQRHLLRGRQDRQFAGGSRAGKLSHLLDLLLCVWAASLVSRVGIDFTNWRIAPLQPAAQDDLNGH
jgi:hypothetical protein